MNVETLQAIDHLSLVLQEDKNSTPDQNTDAVNRWLQMGLQELIDELSQSLKFNNVFTNDFDLFVYGYSASDVAATTEKEFLSRIEWDKVHEWLRGDWRLSYEANQWMRFEFRKWARALMPDRNAVSKWTEIRTNTDPKDITRYQFARAMELLHQGSTTGNDLFYQFRKGHDAQAVMALVKEFIT